MNNKILGRIVLVGIGLSMPSGSLSAQEIGLDSLLSLAHNVHALAQQYLDEKGDTQTSADLLLAQYGRSARYNSANWENIAGLLPADFKTLADENYSSFPLIQTIGLPNGDQLDAPHFWAVINASYYGNGDLGGWGGDLIQMAQDLKSQPDATFPTTQFNREDWISDADGYIIYNTYSDNLLAGMESYYTPELTEQDRVRGFDNGKKIADRFKSSSNYFMMYLLMLSYSVSQNDLALAAQRLQDYIDPYLEEEEAMPQLINDSKEASFSRYGLDGKMIEQGKELPRLYIESGKVRIIQ